MTSVASDPILLVEGGGGARGELADALRSLQPVVAVATAREAAAELAARPYRLLVTNAALPDGSGLELLADTRRRWPDVAVILVAPEGTVADAVEAIRAGAEDFVAGPADAGQIVLAVRKSLASVHRLGERAPDATDAARELLGDSRVLQKVREQCARAAAGSATVLLRGESGTGKEVAARAIHAASSRANGPLVKVHCASLPDNLLESELFGYEKGAFTGAVTRKPGRVEIAAGGTLFLDEIGDVTPVVQVKLLRLLQDREFERLGGTRTERAEVRFVAATHRDLEGMIKKGEFREDLFYRLNVLPIWMPPLRARRDDIDVLARHFCRRFGEENGRPQIAIGDEAIAALRAQRWPGNVRQLANVVERLVVLSDGPRIGVDEVRNELGESTHFTTQMTADGLVITSAGAGDAAASNASSPDVLPLQTELFAAERRALERALAHTRGNRTLAARLLGISRATLYNKLDQHGLG